MKPARFWPLAAIIILPVLVLAGVAAWGLSAQRRAALADAQGQARDVAARFSARLAERLAKMEQSARFTSGIRLPIPPETVATEAMKALHAAIDARDTEALKRLASVGPGGKSAAGLPTHTLAAVAGLELDPLAPEFFDEAHLDRDPSVLTEKWLLRVEEKAARMPAPAPGLLSDTHPFYLLKNSATHARQNWHHDEWVRRALWDAATEQWKTRQPGPHVVGGEVFWICHPGSASKYSTGWQTEGSIAVLTEDSLAGMLGEWWDFEIPVWMGVSVLLEGVPLHAAPKHVLKGVSLVGDRDGLQRVAEGDWGAREEWLEVPGRSEVLATAGGIFTVQLTLREPRLLYAATDRMEVWTGWTLASAVLTAGIGLWLLWRTLNKERRLGELKSQFVSSVSHELRAPIGSMRLMAEGLASGRVRGEAAGEFHRLMAGEGARLSALIENVLDFARIEQGRKEYAMAETDVAALLGECVALMQPQAEAKGLHILLECEPLPFVPRVDAASVQQAVINLLDNAVKFTPPVAGAASPPGSPDAPATAIRVCLAPEPGRWSISVADPGPGIPAAEHARIFERFYRLGNELRRETTGTGIGLAIVKHIMEGHGGKVVVESAVGQGSVFTLFFPAAL